MLYFVDVRDGDEWRQMTATNCPELAADKAAALKDITNRPTRVRPSHIDERELESIALVFEVLE